MPIRPALLFVCRVLLRVFFRRIEVVGAHHVPADGPIIFALNHPSGLIDPLFVLCLPERRVSFLAKEPLFRMPLVGLFVRAFECLPVYRARDGAHPAKNRKMIDDAAALLERGNALAIFPEGTSHSDPEPKAFKTGAARIALSAGSARSPEQVPVRIVVAALYYEQKDVFRSRAVLAYGHPIEVPRVHLDESNRPPKDAVTNLTRVLEERLRAHLPTADTVEGLVLAEQAERVLTLERRRNSASVDSRISLGQRMATRRHLIDAYQQLNTERPVEVDALIKEVEALADTLEEAGLAIDAPLQSASPWLSGRGRLLLLALVLSPVALFGLVVHFPTHELVRHLAFRYAGSELDVVATGKLLGGILLYPLTWLLWAAGLAYVFSYPWCLLAVCAGPPLGWLTLRWQEAWSAYLRRRKTARTLRRQSLNWSAIAAERGALAVKIKNLLDQV